MQKAKRLIAIEKIISGENISSQDELLKKLRGKGISCTQATLSRDLRQLGVGRVAGGTGGYRYMLPGSPGNADLKSLKLNIVPVIRDVIEANHLIIIRTLPGNASNTALVIDGAGRYEIAGTIAGDDTILVIPRDGITMQQVHACIEIILPGVHEHIKKQAAG
jgi:transcriptional regulator of arginine metabolism